MINIKENRLRLDKVLSYHTQIHDRGDKSYGFLCVYFENNSKGLDILFNDLNELKEVVKYLDFHFGVEEISFKPEMEKAVLYINQKPWDK
jgi:hypothetical protein